MLILPVSSANNASKPLPQPLRLEAVRLAQVVSQLTVSVATQANTYCHLLLAVSVAVQQEHMHEQTSTGVVIAIKLPQLT